MMLWKTPIKYWKSAVILSLAALICLQPEKGRGDCTPDYRRFQGYSFLKSSIIRGDAPGAAYVLGFSKLYEQFGRQNANMRAENIEEWRSRYCNKADAYDIDMVIYGMSIPELQELLSAIEVKGYGLSTALRGNTFAMYLYRNGCAETIQYLLYTRECSPLVEQPIDWVKDPLLLDRANRLIIQGRDELMRCNSHYIRVRYAYQMIRLAHYTKQYERTVELYNWLRPKCDNDPSLIDFWMLGHKAGALKALGRNVEAAYDFTRIFHYCPSKRESALQSFSIKTDQEWEETVKLCKTYGEKTALLAIRSFGRHSRALEDMEAIYALDPQSPYLDVLLVRELRRLEKQLLGVEFNAHRAQNKRYHNIPQPGAHDYLIRLKQLVLKALAEGQLHNPQLWLLSDGYLEVIAGDYYAAKVSFDRNRSKIKDEGLREQLEVLELVTKIGLVQEIGDNSEEDIAKLMFDNPVVLQNQARFNNFSADKMAWLFQRYNMPGKAFLAKGNFIDLKVNPQEALIRDLEKMLEQKRLNRYERSLLMTSDTALTLFDVKMLKATMLIDQYSLPAALETIKFIEDPNTVSAYGVWDPFIVRDFDCVHCPIRDTMTLLNRRQIVDQILNLEYQAMTDRTNGAMAFFKLGMAYYNMSYFGHAWSVMDNFRSGASLKARKDAKDPAVVMSDQFSMGNREHFDCSRALYYFDQARQFANNPEVAARATFMAARCEQNQYFWRRGERTYTYFNILKTQYANTAFYARMVNECKYFKSYVAR
jgi:hypothetical protein